MLNPCRGAAPRRALGGVNTHGHPSIHKTVRGHAAPTTEPREGDVRRLAPSRPVQTNRSTWAKVVAAVARSVCLSVCCAKCGRHPPVSSELVLLFYSPVIILYTQTRSPFSVLPFLGKFTTGSTNTNTNHHTTTMPTKRP